MGQNLGKQGIFPGRTSSIELMLQHGLCVVGDVVGPEGLEMGTLSRGVPGRDGA